jgi:glycosyltransferase involved in cell wall biosynthesis
MSNPLVSIITPCFQQAKWLETCMLSVLNQSYSNIEYIVIDGGSTDGSKEIIQKYANRLTYWQSQKDAGQANALNIAYKKAKGKFIAFINADDVLEPWAVETIIRVNEVNPEFGVIYGKCKTIDTDGAIVEEGKGEQIRFEGLVSKGMLPAMYQPACFFNREYLRPDFFVNEKYKFAFDYELVLHLANQKTILFVNRDLASYRVHAESKTALNTYAANKEKIAIQQLYSPEKFLKWKWLAIKNQLAKLLGKIH